MKQSELAARSQEVLRAVVDIFVESGEPVGSRTLSKHTNISFSPATIRNIMSDLADAGFLTNAHVSSGRLPTDLGYRVFVDKLMSSHEITDEEKYTLSQSYSKQAAQIEQILAQASRILSELTNTAGLVLLPATEQLYFKHIDFIRMSAKKVLAVIVSKSGIVQNRVVPTENDIAQDELERVSRFMNEEFSGLALSDVRQKIIGRMNEDRDSLDQLYRQALELSQKALSDDADHEDSVYVEGASRVFSQPDFASDTERLQALYRTFEEKEKLIRLLDKCMASSEMTILIGEENDLEDIKDCSLVAQRYYMGDRPLGTIGIIGPKRMRYDRAVSLVEWTASSVTRYISTDDSS